MTINDKNNLSPKSKRRKTADKLAQPTPQLKGQRFKERWLELNSDVHSALCYWDDLTQKYDGKMNRDQEHLQEIKSLLKALQKKLKVFGE